MRALIVVALLALAGCAASGDRSYHAAGSASTVADRMGSGANAQKSGEPVKSGSALTSDLLARPGRL